MPSEQLPWYGKDLRKDECSTPVSGFVSGKPYRWRDHCRSYTPPAPSYQQHQNQRQPQRWYSDFRPPRPMSTVHGKQGGLRLHSNESGIGFPSLEYRHGEKPVEDDIIPHQPSFCGYKRYFHGSRATREVFSQKYWRSPNLESSAASSYGRNPTNRFNILNSEENMPMRYNSNSKNSYSPRPVSNLPFLNDKTDGSADCVHMSRQKSAPSRPKEVVNNQNPVGSSSAWSDSGWNFNVLPSSYHHSILKEKHDNVMDHDDAIRLKQKNEDENNMETNWKSQKWSRSGAFLSGHLVFGDPNTEVHTNEAGANSPIQRMMINESFAFGACVLSNAPSSVDDTASRKKPRLSCREGLTSYENKKESDNSVEKGSDKETVQCPRSLFDRGTRDASLPLCTSATLSPGTKDSECVNPVSGDRKDTPLKSSSISSLAECKSPPINLENLCELSSASILSSLANHLLHSNASRSVGPLRKLLVLKANVFKAIEATESEIDSLETDYKSLVGDCRSCFPFSSNSNFPIGESCIRSCEAHSCANTDETKAAMTADLKALQSEGFDSSCIASAKLDDPSPSGSPLETSECIGHPRVNPVSSDRFHQTHFMDSLSCGNHLYDFIISSNKDSASKVNDNLNKLLPSEWHLFDAFTSSRTSSMPKDCLAIKRKLMKKKRALKFNDKVLILKYKVFNHFRNKARVLSLRKLRGKSHEMLDPSQNPSNIDHPSSLAILPCSSGDLHTVSKEEIISLVNGLLSSSPFLPCQSNLKMPALSFYSMTKMPRFVSNNGLIDDPCAAEKEKSMINPWTVEEKDIFTDKLTIFGKDFRRIASFLDHKTVADCVEFYYKNHRSECFSYPKKKLDFSKRKSQSSTFLVGAGRRRNLEVNVVPLSGLNEVVQTIDHVEMPLKGAMVLYNNSRTDKCALRLSNNMNMYSDYTAAVDVLADICGSLSSEAMSSMTSSTEPTDAFHYLKSFIHNDALSADKESEESCEVQTSLTKPRTCLELVLIEPAAANLASASITRKEECLLSSKLNSRQKHIFVGASNSHVDSAAPEPTLRILDCEPLDDKYEAELKSVGISSEASSITDEERGSDFISLSGRAAGTTKSCGGVTSRAISYASQSMDASAVLFPVPTAHQNLCNTGGFQNVGSSGAGKLHSHSKTNLEVDYGTHGKLVSHWSKEFFLQKCSSSKSQQETVAEKFQSYGQICGPNNQSDYYSSLDRPSSKGDVKLFGQILAPSQPKCILQMAADGHGQHHKELMDLKFSGSLQL